MVNIPSNPLQEILNFQYWVNGILAAIVSIFGFSGNFVSIYVLLQPNMRNSFNQLLIALCVSDSFFICCNFLRAGSAINMGQTPGESEMVGIDADAGVKDKLS